MATIRITDLKLNTIIGINAWERKVKQTILINAIIEFDANKAIKSDKLTDTLDYKAITKKILNEIKSSQFFLLERLTARVLDIIHSFNGVKKATVRIDKPRALRYAKSVSIELTK